ncbi:MAG: hypothetical protein AAGH72_00985 [Verrucomicrobiota bacterium]
MSPVKAKIILLTDLSDWCQPWTDALSDARMVTEPEEAGSEGVLFNRVSSGSMQHRPKWTQWVEAYLQQQEEAGRQVIHGAKVMRLGCDKLVQAEHFRQCLVATPATAPINSSQRAFPDRTVLLKPVSGGYGEGIRVLAPGEEIPLSVVHGKQAMIEQEKINPVDGCVHRVEWIGDGILYDAATPLTDVTTNYCLRTTGDQTDLQTDLPARRIEEVTRILLRAGMVVGSIEYLLQPDGEACYFDLNPVSTFHPRTESLFGVNPYQYFAEWFSKKYAS